MKGITLCLSILLLFTFAASAAETVEAPASCQICGMDRTMFARSRMLIAYADGGSTGVCSIHCAAEELLKSKGKQIKSLMVADYTTGKLIDARSAAWVIGGAKRGVMTMVAKWAFTDADGARRFVEEYGGQVTSFDKAMEAATEEVRKGMAEEMDVEKEMLRETR